jgi:hypothetical protein
MSDDLEIVQVADPVEEPLNNLIERWWTDHFPGSPIARDTAAWNAAHAAKEALKRVLATAWADQNFQRSI